MPRLQVSDFPFTERNPYTPGVDRAPPVFPGRAEEIRLLDEIGRQLAGDLIRGEDVVFFGPKGNGKTALLNYCRPILEETHKIRTILVYPQHITTPLELYGKLLGKSVPAERTVSRKGGGSLAGFLGGSRQSSKVYTSTPNKLEERCIKAMRRQPTLLMVDEAQEIEGSSLRAILSLARAAHGRETKFRFALAGTPDLSSQLRRVGPPNVDRLEQIRIDCLDIESANTALFEPMAKADFNIKLTKDQRGNLIEQSQCYPHFIQCIGHAIWETGKENGARDVDAELVEQARPEWERQIRHMYMDRQGEIVERGLNQYAYAIAEWFMQGNTHIYEHALIDTIRKCDKDADAIEAKTALVDLGYIWHTDEDVEMFVPGIPSLMDHIYSRGRAQGIDAQQLDRGRSDKLDQSN